MPSRSMAVATVAVRGYVVLVAVTLVALVVMSLTHSSSATSDAWVHTVIVAVFALLLPIRLRSARSGNRGAIRALGIIAAVLLVVNVVEAQLNAFPGWLRVQMVVVAVLMLAVVGAVITDRVRAVRADDAEWAGGSPR